MRAALRALLAVLAMLGCALPLAPARAATGPSMHPSLLPDRLGASTAFTLALRFSGGTEGDATHGLWKGSWEVSDTHDTVYNIIIAATDKTSSSSVQITLP